MGTGTAVSGLAGRGVFMLQFSPRFPAPRGDNEAHNDGYRDEHDEPIHQVPISHSRTISPPRRGLIFRVNLRYGGRYRSPVQTVAGNDYRRSRLSDGVGCQGIVTNRSPLGGWSADQRRGGQQRSRVKRSWGDTKPRDNRQLTKPTATTTTTDAAATADMRHTKFGISSMLADSCWCGLTSSL